jgi:transcriptional regulator GlxA family with amidase domain
LSEPFRSLLRAVHDDPAGENSVAAMAARAGVSVRHLNRLFLEHAGTTPARYVQRVRIEAAKKQLRRSRAPFAAVAGRTGFGSVETMRRAFLRTVDLTPGAYRDRARPAGGAR